MTYRQKSIFWISFFALLVLFLGAVSQILLPFIVAFLVAYFLDPWADKLEDLGLSRSSAAATITLLFIAILSLLLFLIVPPAQAQLLQLITVLPRYAIELKLKYLPQLTPLIEQYGLKEQVQKVQNGEVISAGSALEYTKQIVARVLQSGFALINLVSLLFLSPVVSFYMLRDWDVMVAKIRKLLPRRHENTICKLFSDMDDTFSGFMHGYTHVILFLVTFYSISLTIVGLNYGLVIGLMTGILTFLPYVGVTIGMVVGLTVAYFQYSGDFQHISIVLGVFIVGQFVEGNFITPKLVGDKIGLHPVWIIFALLASGALFGFVGVVIAIPAAACLGVLIRFGINYYLKSSLYGASKTAKPKKIT